MKTVSSNGRKAVWSKAIMAVVVMLAVVLVPVMSAQAASKPAISSKSKNILIGQTYDLNVKNEIKGSTYEWSSSDTRVATVSKAGLVKAKVKGTAVITCKVTAPNKKVYELTATVKSVYGAKEFTISNKVKALNKGQVYDLNRKLSPSHSNDVTTWTSSNTSIAKPDKNGKFTALKAGTVTITGKTLSGESDSVTIKVVDKVGTVSTQKELEELLGSGVQKITISTNDKVTFNIPSGEYKKTKLVVDAPNADVYNYGVFESIELQKIAADTWHEEAQGNELVILAGNARVVVGEKASVKIEVTAQGAKITIENNGVITEVVMEKASEITVSGKSEQPVPVVVKAEGVKVTSSVPLKVEAQAKATLTLLPGAEKSTVVVDKKENVPAIKGDITLDITVGTGDNATKETVKGEKTDGSKDTTTPTPGGGGNPGGGTTPTPTPKPVEKIKINDNTYQYVLADSYKKLKTIAVTYSNVTYNVTEGMMDVLKAYLGAETEKLDRWNKGPAVTGKELGGVTVDATAPSNGTRTITIVKTPVGLLENNKYEVTVSVDGTVTVKSVQSNKSFVIKKIGEKTLEIQSDIPSLSFDPKFN
jgi:hypothetical protein